MSSCQICGRPIKAKTGVIAHHGYKRPGNGWQTSSCMGARHLPYEKSCDLIPEAITNVTGFIDTVGARLAYFLANPPDTLLYQPHSTWEKRPMARADRPDGFTVEGRRSHRPHHYDTIFHERAYEMQQQIKFAGYDLTFLKDRLANWKLVLDE